MRELIRLGSFPDNYQFRSRSRAGYLIGMSVPPRMMQFVAGEVTRQWLT
jgi:site-specific DNA-cytosine methylase